MSEPIRIAGLSGSLRKASTNTALLRAATELLPEGVTLDLLSIGDLPHYDADIQAEGFPASVQALHAAVLDADAVLIASPEYNYSVPGVLKNAIDWLSRTDPQPFLRKPIAIMGASPGRLGTARMQYHLRQIFVFLDGDVLNKPEVMVGGAFQAVQDGRLVDERAREIIGRLVEALCARVGERRRLAR